jgi:hypothetical protein
LSGRDTSNWYLFPVNAEVMSTISRVRTSAEAEIWVAANVRNRRIDIFFTM